jgi:hypothetical protein
MTLNKTLTILGILALASTAPMVAQTTGASPEDARTNPSARSAAGDSKLTIEGTISSMNDSEIVLATETGAEHIKLTDTTQVAVGLKTGDRVSVDYTRTSMGVMLGQLVRSASAAAVAGSATTHSEPMADKPMAASASNHTAKATAPDAAMANDSAKANRPLVAANTTTTDSEYGNSQSEARAPRNERLPQTASNLPLVLVLGLGSAVGAFGLRAALR